MATPVSRVILYVKDVAKVAAFYQRHFGMTPLPDNDEGWVELSRNCRAAASARAAYRRVRRRSGNLRDNSVPKTPAATRKVTRAASNGKVSLLRRIIRRSANGMIVTVMISPVTRREDIV